MRYNCKRCGFETQYKQVLVRHLQKKKTCEGGISRSDLLHELGVVKMENSHQSNQSDNINKICDTKNLVDIEALMDELKDLRQKVNKLEFNHSTQPQTVVNDLDDMKGPNTLKYYKVKHEIFVVIKNEAGGAEVVRIAPLGCET